MFKKKDYTVKRIYMMEGRKIYESNEETIINNVFVYSINFGHANNNAVYRCNYDSRSGNKGET